MGLLTSIREGKYDNDLERIVRAIQQRRQIISANRFYELKIGQEVQFVSTIRPTYLAGVRCKVVGKKVKKIIVRPVSPVGRFRGDITCSPALVELVVREGSSD